MTKRNPFVKTYMYLLRRSGICIGKHAPPPRGEKYHQMSYLGGKREISRKRKRRKMEKNEKSKKKRTEIKRVK
jgi:hypothetical protein